MENQNLQLVDIASARESKTNPRGKNFEDESFAELVASIEAKGILQPVLLRPMQAGYEVVAGNRRFRAAQKLGLAQIPAVVIEMTDDEAREAQIIENLQRADVHPLEEGEAYRQLIEKSQLSIKVIAARVGKSESYVRYRLFLTNLSPKVAAAYRAGKLNDGHAVLIAELSPANQEMTLKEYNSYGGNGMTISRLKEYIKKTFSNPLAFQPWLKDEAIAKVVGPCVECPPSKPTLFGEIKAGQCTDLKCWQRKINLYIADKVKQAKAKGETMLRIKKAYYWGDEKVIAGVLTADQYKPLGTVTKKHCKYAQRAIVAAGDGLGQIQWVCASKECKTHSGEHVPYKQTPAERERRKKEIAAEKDKETKLQEHMENVLNAKVVWPMTEKNLDVLLHTWLQSNHIRTENGHRVFKRRGWQAPKGTGINWNTEVRKKLELLTNLEKLRLLTELSIDGAFFTERRKTVDML